MPKIARKRRTRSAPTPPIARALADRADRPTDARSATPQRTGDMFYDNLAAAQAAGTVVNTYDGIIVIVMAPFLRGAAYGNWDRHALVQRRRLAAA